MATTITGLEELEEHLQKLSEDPEAPLNAKLFDEVELQLNGKLLLHRCLNPPFLASRF
jgi:hypothetical protein